MTATAATVKSREFCTYPSGVHKFVGGTCTRCGTPEAAPAELPKETVQMFTRLFNLEHTVRITGAQGSRPSEFNAAGHEADRRKFDEAFDKVANAGLLREYGEWRKAQLS